MMTPQQLWKQAYQQARKNPDKVNYCAVAGRALVVSDKGVYPVRRYMAGYYRRISFQAMNARKTSCDPDLDLQKARIFREHSQHQGFKLP